MKPIFILMVSLLAVHTVSFSFPLFLPPLLGKGNHWFRHIAYVYIDESAPLYQHPRLIGAVMKPLLGVVFG